jgi:hypothetical protein
VPFVITCPVCDANYRVTEVDSVRIEDTSRRVVSVGLVVLVGLGVLLCLFLGWVMLTW